MMEQKLFDVAHWWGHARCADGRIMAHHPQSDDPDHEVDVGQCPNFEMGTGCCEQCKGEALGLALANEQEGK
jgi:hypothetical protein